MQLYTRVVNSHALQPVRTMYGTPHPCATHQTWHEPRNKPGVGHTTMFRGKHHGAVWHHAKNATRV